MLNISFFSYKGGSGRTSLLYNTLPFIAEKMGATSDTPILVVDFDIDSKGLSYLVDKKSGINAIQVLKGDSAIDFRRARSIKEHPLFKSAVPIGNLVGLSPRKSDAILFISAHAMNENLGDASNFDGKNVRLTRLNQICQDFDCKAIVMDTPAGRQLSADAALSISDKIVTTMRITQQFRKGTYEFLREVSKRFNDAKEFVIVPNAVPDFSKKEMDDYDLNAILKNINENINNTVANNCKVNFEMMDTTSGYYGIGEVERFKFEEGCLYAKGYEQLKEDEKKAYKCYEHLAEVLVNG